MIQVRRDLTNPGVLAVAGTVVVLLLVVVLLGHEGLPFKRPLLAGTSFGYQLTAQVLQFAWALLLLIPIYLVTRRRSVPRLSDRAPVTSLARVETLGMIVYGLAGQGVGLLLGRALGLHPITLHLPGTIYGLSGTVTYGEVFLWLVYNFAVYAAVPYMFFRSRGYSNEQLNLKSNDRRQDLLLIVVVLILQVSFDFVTAPAIFRLSLTQLLIGAPLAFVTYSVGTVVPIMIFIYAILLPRYMRITGSISITVLLGGLTYAAMHLFDAWALYDSFRDVALSLAVIGLQYTPFGMVKSFVTIRTANAWVHAIAYHSIAPHVTIDTVNVVRIFGIR